jgi:hypothetical protein
MPIQIRILPLVLQVLGGKKSELFFTFIHSDASLHCFIFIVSFLDVINLQYFRQYLYPVYLKILRKKYSLAFFWLTWILIRIHICLGQGQCCRFGMMYFGSGCNFLNHIRYGLCSGSKY